jgi:cysteine synthase
MNHDTRVYESIFEMLPSEENPTPLVRINKLNARAEFQAYAKLEWINPFGSVKDRAAWALLRDLESRGELDNGCEMVEPTSGNSGISLAAMARAGGHRLLVPNKVPLETAPVEKG